MKDKAGATWRRFGVVAALLAVVVWAGTGCEGGGGGGGSFTGTWALYEGAAGEGTPSQYVHFMSDGTYFYSADQAGTESTISGTYTVSGGTLDGPFSYPGVGDGETKATIANNVMSLDFIEHWHDPYKVIPYTGIKQ